MRAAELYDIEAIRAAHPLTDLVQSAGVELRRSGARLVGRCPFHEDRDPSFVVYPQTDSYFCFGCDAGGDVIDFVGRLRGTAFKETATFLADRQPPPTPKVVRFPAVTRAAAVSAEEVAVVEAAASLYSRQLKRSRKARSYLGGRGVDAQTAERLTLGYAAGGLHGELRKRGLDLNAAHHLGLLRSDRDTLLGRVVIPDDDGAGTVNWLTARAVDDRPPRYLNVRLPSPLLGLSRARSTGARAVVVTEGPFDWLTACTWELQAVALLGTHLSRAALHALRSFRRVYLALDADGAGRRATAQLVSELGRRAVVVSLPTGVHDLNELGCRRDGRDVFLRSLYDARERTEESWPSRTGPDHRARAA